MASNQDRAERWMDRALGRADRDLGTNGTVFYRGDSIFSYGSHFEMACVMRDRYEQASWVLVNGDSYSPTTTQHQGQVRDVVRRSGLPSIIIPFTALSGAGIDFESIEIIDVRKDRSVENHHSAPNVTGDHLEMDDPEGRTKAVERSRSIVNPAYVERNEGCEVGDMDFSIPRTVQEKYEEEVPLRVPNPNRRYLTQRSHNSAEWDEDARLWRWTTHTHFLGDSIFYARARGDRGRTKWLSSFDYQEARPLYFLCQLPRANDAWNVEQAIESLKPETVKMAESAGLDIERQGDIFAIPTNMTTREVKKLTPWGKGKIVKRPRIVLGTNHTATNVIYATGDRVYARGVMYHDPDRRAPDHARRKLGGGKTWYLLTRNTVPRQRAPRRTNAQTGVNI